LDDNSSFEWAAGGTGLITQDYPDDSLFESASLCSLILTERTTGGPCYLGVSEREDISDGQIGLPMMLCLQVVDQNCNPLEGYLVEVWHCNREGIYSGDETENDDTSTFAGNFCIANDEEAEKSTWFRGEQVSDSSGRINFKTCFDDSFCEDICTNHNLYSARGAQDTPLSGGTDTVFPDSHYDNFIMNTIQNDDGTLLGYKRIMIEV
jgi:hypothetical protein